MTTPLRLVIFDVDGTLVDSQAQIVAAMTTAFQTLDLPVPQRERILSIIGLSLEQAMLRLASDQDRDVHAALVKYYREAFMDNRLRSGADGVPPLYPGARDALETLSDRDDVLLGIATGKSRRGLHALIEVHELEGMFVTSQVADDHPSKPHPSMILTALAETGVDARDAVMIGDTSFDMDMARSAGVAALAVGWGYHPAKVLRQANDLLETFAQLEPTLEQIWSVAS